MIKTIFFSAEELKKELLEKGMTDSASETYCNILEYPILLDKEIKVEGDRAFISYMNLGPVLKTT